jgi:hypothetical protein
LELSLMSCPAVHAIMQRVVAAGKRRRRFLVCA